MKHSMEKNNDKTDTERRWLKKYTMPFRATAGLAFVMALGLQARASFLPAELRAWHLSSEHITELAASEDLGKWASASYIRSSPAGGIEVQLTEGPGPGELFVPGGMISSDDGPIGFLSTYETLDVAGRHAILERNYVTGQALAVALGTDRTITFETNSISREELLSFAVILIEALMNE